ncbi:MAG: ABC1 kinase family protein [Halanaerobiaceae bacterium]
MDLNLSRQYRHIHRYQQIAQILLKNGLGFLLDRLELKKYLPFKKRLNIDTENINKPTLAKRVKNVLQELGTTYIKLGQIMSTRPDILPPVFIKELRKLQDEVKPVEFEKIDKIIKEELKHKYNQLQNINPESRANASIAQTHHAVLEDGSDVILKVQRPDIESKIKIDLEILSSLADLIKQRNFVGDFVDPVKIVEEFKDSLFKELDFSREVSNMKLFDSNFSDNPSITTPQVYENLSTKKLIVMEEIKGIKLNELSSASNRDIDREYLAKVGARAFMKQVLIDGFFHADPHPGNIFIVDKNKIAYIDFGLMGQLTPEIQTQFSLLFFAILRKNINVIVDIIFDIGGIPKDINVRKFKLEIHELFNRYYGLDLGEIDFPSLFDDFERIIYKFHIRMPDEFFLLIRAIAVSEGVGYNIDPSFNLVEVGNEFLQDLIKAKVTPKNLFYNLLNKTWKLRNATRDIPSKFKKIGDKIIEDDFTINFKHQNLENLIQKLDIVSNRLSISLIVSALIIGSTMILQTDMEPQIFNIPLFGLIGYSVAGVLGFILIIAILKSGKF